MAKKKKKVVELGDWGVVVLEGRQRLHVLGFTVLPGRGQAIWKFGSDYQQERKAGRVKAIRLCGRI